MADQDAKLKRPECQGRGMTGYEETAEMCSACKGTGQKEPDKSGACNSEDCACKGAPTRSFGDMEACEACGVAVRWDKVNDPLFGFAAACENHQSGHSALAVL